MKMIRRNLLPFLAAAVACAAAATPAAAQEDVMRDVYGFFGSALDVEVATEGAGQIRLIRGRRSRIEVAGRAPNGFTSAALGGRGVRRLTLTALGGERADFVVVVPEDVRVRVLWPGTRRSEQFGTLSQSATFAWEPVEQRPMIETIGGADGATTRLDLPSVPRALDVRSAHRLDRLTIRIEGEVFSIAASRPIVSRPAGERLTLDAPTGADVTVMVPTDATFSVELDGVPAIDISGGDVRVLCESVLSQTLSDGSRWLTLTPVPRGGCSRPAPPTRNAQPAAARRT